MDEDNGEPLDDIGEVEGELAEVEEAGKPTCDEIKAEVGGEA